MSKPDPDDPEVLMSIDLSQLETVSGGKSHGDPVLNQLSSLATSIKDLTAKTSGFSSSQMLLLGLLFLRNNAPAHTNVVYVSRNRW